MATQIFTTNYEHEEFKTLLSEFISEAIHKEISCLSHIVEAKKTILTRQETAKMLDISLPTLHDYTKRNLIKAFRLGSKVRYRLSDIEEALIQIKVR